MNRLFKLKEWLTIDEAAKHLTSVMGEDVSVSDVLRLALDDYLIVSINFLSGVLAYKSELKEWPEDSNSETSNVTVKYGKKGGARIFSEKPTLISETWDLLLLAGDRNEIEYLCHSSTGAPGELFPVAEPWVVKCDNQIYRLKEAGRPEGSLLVVKTEEIMRFLETLGCSQTDSEKPISSKERNTLLILIAALCKEANVDYKKRGIASSLALMTEQLGAPVSDDTIRKVIKQIDDAVELRNK